MNQAPRLITLYAYFAPSHRKAAFGDIRLTRPPLVIIPVLSSTLLPGFNGRNFITTTGASATSHSHCSQITSRTACLEKTPRYSARLPRLLHQPPARYSVLNHCVITDRVSGFALFCTLTAYAQPNQVCLRYVHLTSYGFLQTPPLASDALAIQIVFPSVGVTWLSFKPLGLPALPGKQKAPSLLTGPCFCYPITAAGPKAMV
jgi:hypothetical protein